jgi:hypothetical protein
VTKYVASLTPTSQSSALPAPSLDSLFDRSVIGTSQGSFTGDLYRDDAGDAAWVLLPKGTTGVFYVSRFGGTGTDLRPVAGQTVEVWPVAITQRAGGGMTSNQLQTFTLAAAIPDPPAEDAIVAASSGVPSAPLHLKVTSSGAGIADLDWDLPSFVGTGITGYKVYKGSTSAACIANGTAESAGLTQTGTIAIDTSLATGTWWFQVLASNASGDGPRCAPVSVAVA